VSPSARFARFLITGGIAAAVNIASRLVFSQFLSYGLAILAAYVCGMITAWLLARWLVFERSQSHWGRELARFALVNVAGAAQVWLVSEALVRFLFPGIGFTFHADLFAHIVGVASPVLTSYVAHRKFTFARSGI
jgi:putative flippase GtrA